MSNNLIFIGFYAFLLNFFKIQWYFVDYGVKFYIREVFFLEEWFLDLQNPIFLVFFEFSEACLS